MSWATSKDSITSILDSNGYYAVPYNFNIDEIPESSIDKHYELKPLADVTEASAGTIIATGGELLIYYRVPSESAYDNAYDSFIDVVVKILQAGFSLLSNPDFYRDEDDNKLAIGEVQFNIETTIA